MFYVFFTAIHLSFPQFYFIHGIPFISPSEPPCAPFPAKTESPCALPAPADRPLSRRTTRS